MVLDWVSASHEVISMIKPRSIVAPQRSTYVQDPSKGFISVSNPFTEWATVEMLRSKKWTATDQYDKEAELNSVARELAKIMAMLIGALREQPLLPEPEIEKKFHKCAILPSGIRRRLFSACQHLADNWSSEIDYHDFMEPLKDQIRLGDQFDDVDWELLGRKNSQKTTRAIEQKRSNDGSKNNSGSGSDSRDGTVMENSRRKLLFPRKREGSSTRG
ncbi:hypothetical protein GGP41_009373 [Bipolaris sorokiniana]|uniref:Uncharacterized protein n=1 Tax=Cochliobolus sativus TaxID=45130 RepID=A0A8H5ZBH3_COCSA|nr:hypothetical protein GGP41_009373 [Bipolaris sorokiniana]